MILRILTFVAVMAMSVINLANAGYFSAKKLLAECEPQSSTNRAICNGYLAGVNDAHELHSELGKEAKKIYLHSCGR